MSDRPTTRYSSRVIWLVLSAIPFWGAVRFLDPLAPLRPRPPAVQFETQAPQPSPMRLRRCRDLQLVMKQSLQNCAFVIPRRAGPMLPPGDYPLPRLPPERALTRGMDLPRMLGGSWRSGQL